MGDVPFSLDAVIVIIGSWIIGNDIVSFVVVLRANARGR